MRKSPVILLPGIKGSELINTYPLAHDTTWSVTNMVYENPYQLALGKSGHTDQGVEIIHRPGPVFGEVYGELFDQLRSVLDVPVFLFGYDWRLSVTANGKRLVEFIRHLRKKEGLSQKQKFHFVCHSMGGLVLRSALHQWPGHLPVDRIVFLATPHRGSLDAVNGMISGESVVFFSRQHIRKVVRTMPGVYDLLPSYADAVILNGHSVNIFHRKHWQSNVCQDGKKYQVSDSHLKQAQQVREEKLHSLEGLQSNQVLQLYGWGEENTLQQVEVLSRHRETRNWYDFSNAIKGHGDEVVLAEESAKLQGFPSVQIRREDIGLFNLLDQFKVRGLSFHAFLPIINGVKTIIGRYLQGTEPGVRLLPRNMDPERYQEG